jgi:hypothetical protein
MAAVQPVDKAVGVVHPTLEHHVDLLTQTSFLLWTWNTMVVAVVSTAISKRRRASTG